MLRKLFLQALPDTQRAIIAASDNLPLLKLAKIADKITETVGHDKGYCYSIMSATSDSSRTPSSRTPQHAYFTEVTTLSEQIAALQASLTAINRERD